MRSAIVSVVLGAHPSPVSAAGLVRAGAHVGLPASGVRVALSRGVATGDLARLEGGYVLGPRQLHRHARQRAALTDVGDGPWDGTWETAVVVTSGRPTAERAALRALLQDDRLAELREGVWLRPANLTRAPAHAGHPDLLCVRALAAAEEDGRMLAARLWDLDGWADVGRRLGDWLAQARDPMDRLTIAAGLVRHLAEDPLLPAALLPDDWPGRELRVVYDAYQDELRALPLL
ncbi:PaaX domain-containing protein, C- domain protein [Nocardioides sp. TRM66260-LWL]|uniref:PaaX family transcriptional regulator C-terminal domain-containing protein n=1 Tax=Nocardioides sp. TRM66260-LWL TaxID=2874478 RepID=UPI001CC65C03|nr:PaaX family transcriptional regulator C-terminal domain-containing protein [Nocardioides sp. TRM66260-LWL]MBZ5734702.1 PaaX domain-containing protein, C- domain protein [Nocardioides sp. TRM66260-LWL]